MQGIRRENPAHNKRGWSRPYIPLEGKSLIYFKVREDFEIRKRDSKFKKIQKIRK